MTRTRPTPRNTAPPTASPELQNKIISFKIFIRVMVWGFFWLVIKFAICQKRFNSFHLSVTFLPQIDTAYPWKSFFCLVFLFFFKRQPVHWLLLLDDRKYIKRLAGYSAHPRNSFEQNSHYEARILVQLKNNNSKLNMYSMLIYPLEDRKDT